MADKRFGRSLLLNGVADSLGIDPTTRRAIPHIETLIGAMAERELTWDDVPDRFGIPQMLPGIKGKLALKLFRKEDGFRLFEAAVNDPALRPPLLDAYVRVIEVATPEQTASIASTIQYLRGEQL